MRGSRKLVTGTVAAAIASSLVAVAAPAWADNTNPPFADSVYTAASAPCAPGIFYASRGSAENLDAQASHADGQKEKDGVTPRTKYYEGLGEEMEPVYSTFRDEYSPGTVALVTNRAPRTAAPGTGGTDPAGPTDFGYRALGISYTQFTIAQNYENSVKDGVNNAVRDLNTLHSRCPSSKLIVAGYSQGAEVSRRALAALTWKPAAGSAFTMLFGDVLWKAGDPNVKYVGDTSANEKGIIRAGKDGDIGLVITDPQNIPAIPNFPAEWNVTSWCHGGDIACQWIGGTLIAHTSYHAEDTYGPAGRAARYFGGPYVRPVATAFLSTDASCLPGGFANLSESLSIAGSPAGTSLTFNAQWEPGPGTAFNPVTLTAPATPTAGRTFFAGVNNRLSVTVNGYKLDYRNSC